SVIYNFCANAMYYSTVETESCLIISDKKDKIVVDVRDYGPSLPTSVWRQIKAGLTAPTSISMRPGSSGLGLYIASKFAKYLNAEVSAVRHRDGTSFQVILPVSHQAILPMFD
ncbi:ATP-binding protein, partial [Candidatus Saccharibacteria bacterium]|nr:ATP-binding protein [Candidatus Saccharibacteria bacterium]